MSCVHKVGVYSAYRMLVEEVKKKVLVAQLCLTLCDPMDCSPPGSSVHGILQARILEWVVISFSRGSSQPRNANLGLLHCRQILYCLSHLGSPVEEGQVEGPRGRL